MNTLTPFRSLFPTTGESLLSRFDMPIDRLWRRFLQMESLGNESFSPPANVVEKADSYVVKVELPGIPREDIHVTLSDNILTIRGEKREEKTEERKDYYLRERSFGAFERSFVLPEDVDAERIEASFRKGVLTVKLPRRPEAQVAARKIDVKAT